MACEETPLPSERSLRGLDAVNLLMADVRDGVGPYLSVFLAGTAHWAPGAIGLAMGASAVAAVDAVDHHGLRFCRGGAERT